MVNEFVPLMQRDADILAGVRVRRRLEVRDAMMGTKIACRVSMNHRQRSCPWSAAGNRSWIWVARAGKIAIGCGLFYFFNQRVSHLRSYSEASPHSVFSR